MSVDDGMTSYWPSELVALKFALKNRPAQVIKRGWPDFAIKFLDDQSYEFFESKSNGKKLSLVQKQCLSFLRNAGLKVSTLQETSNGKEIRLNNNNQIIRLPNFCEFNTKLENNIDYIIK